MAPKNNTQEQGTQEFDNLTTKSRQARELWMIVVI